MNALSDSDALHERVQREIAASMGEQLLRWTEQRFDALARALFAHQYERCAPYRRYCQVQGVQPSSLSSWDAIPAVPTDVFKGLDLCTFPPAEASVTFMTSGTTFGTRGKHLLRRTDTYEASLAPWLDAFLLPTGQRPRILVLAPPAAADPHSSLSHMLQWAVDQRGAPGSTFAWGSDGPEVAQAMSWIEDVAKQDVPAMILGTARALQALLEDALLAHSVSLPAGSCLMETGGFKGASRTLPRDAFYEALGDTLGLPQSSIVSEYGMTELGSQGYHPGFRMASLPASSRLWIDRAAAWPEGILDAHGQPRLLVFPAWCRVRAVDPDSLELLPFGQEGLLRFFDLSNVDSILAIQSADVGLVLPEGVLLRGRAQGSTPRGCSLAVDEILRGALP